METEEFFLVFASLLLFFDIIQLLKVKHREKTKLEYGFYAVTLACGLVLASYYFLLQAFLKNDFGLMEVFTHSSSSMSTLYKISATWAGGSGSMLFLTFLMSIIYFIYRLITYEKRRSADIRAYKVLDFVLLFFIIITLIYSPFQRLPATFMDGGGLTPLLQTFWMAIHPPIVFLGYVFVILAFAVTSASMDVKNKEDTGVLRLILQAAWLFSTLGIAIGGLWSYEVLGWGGYWAWDPVETASLLPWLTLTTYFHSGSAAKQGKTLTGELAVLLSFVGVFFATAITRGGLITSPLHGWDISPLGPILLLPVLCAAVYFIFQKRKTSKPLYDFGIDKSSLLSVSILVGHWSLMLILLVCFFGLALPIIAGFLQGFSFSVSAEYYNNWSFPFVLAFVAALVGCNISERVRLKRYTVLVFGALCVGAILVFIGQPTTNILANFGLPLLALAAGVVGFKLIRNLLKIRSSFRLFGRNLLHLAIVLTLIGVFISSTAKQASGSVSASPNSTVNTLGLVIELKNFTVYEGAGRVHSVALQSCVPEYSALKIDVVIRQGGAIYSGTLWAYLYTGYAYDGYLSSSYGILSKPLIISTLTGDIYVYMEPLDTNVQYTLWLALDPHGESLPPQSFSIRVDWIPMVNLVWIGVFLMVIGLSLPMANEISRLIRKKVKTSETVSAIS